MELNPNSPSALRAKLNLSFKNIPTKRWSKSTNGFLKTSDIIDMCACINYIYNIYHMKHKKHKKTTFLYHLCCFQLSPKIFFEKNTFPIFPFTLHPSIAFATFFFLLQNLWARSAKGSHRGGGRRSTQDRNKRNMAKAQGAIARDP